MSNVTSINGKTAEQDGEADDDMHTLEDMDAEDFEEALPGTSAVMTLGFTSPFDVVKSTLKIRAMPDMLLRGQFEDGDTITYTVTVEVEETAFKPVYDKFKERTGTRRHHVARVVRIDPIEE